MENIKHLAFIMDGNRRWARSRGLPTFEGHRRGYLRMKKVGDWCLERGIKIMTVYAFSTENWKRSKKEVNYLMKLLEDALSKELPEFMEKNIQLRIIGKKNDLPKGLQEAIKNAEKQTKNNTKGILNIAINYGGRQEIVEATKKIVKAKLPPSKINEKLFSEHVWTAGQPDPDLVIRTSGEQRISGFLAWQAVYSELYFCKKHWPAFSEKDLDEAINEFNRRNRRFGGK